MHWAIVLIGSVSSELTSPKRRPRRRHDANNANTNKTHYAITGRRKILNETATFFTVVFCNLRHKNVIGFLEPCRFLFILLDI